MFLCNSYFSYTKEVELNTINERIIFMNVEKVKRNLSYLAFGIWIFSGVMIMDISVIIGPERLTTYGWVFTKVMALFCFVTAPVWLSKKEP